MLKRLKFAALSEAFNAEQKRLIKETIDANLAALQAELDKVVPGEQDKGEKKSPKRQPLPANLPRREIRHEPENTTCACGCALKRIGEDAAEKLDYQPGVFTVELCSPSIPSRSAWRFLRLRLLARLFNWRDALVVVQPPTMIRWHRAGWRLLWRLKSHPGRPAIPMELRELIRRMARENVLGRRAYRQRTAAQAGSADLAANGEQVLAETASWATSRRPGWSTFLSGHARGILACDFFVAVTATFRSARSDASVWTG